jgi:predicted PurR-regulated permease PerM
LAAQSADLNLNVRRFLSGVEALLGRRVVVAGFRIDLQQAIEQAAVSFQGLIEPLFSQTLLFAVEAISSLIWVVFIIVVSFYLVKDSSALFAWLARLTPSGYRQDFIRLRSEINLIWSAFLRGQLTLALVVALIFTGAGFAIGLPYALAMGVLAGLLEFLPSLGHGIWMIIAILLALFAGSTWLPIPNWAFALIIGGLHIFFQQFDLNYLIPRIIGRRVQLPPLVVILGIVTGALIAGVLGVVLAAPTIASARVLGRYIYANLLDWDPFPDAIAQPLPPPNPRWWKKADHEKGGITAKVEDGSHANRD